LPSLLVPNSLADPQRRFQTRPKALVVALFIAVTPAMKRTGKTFAADGTARLDFVDVGIVRGRRIRCEDRCDLGRLVGAHAGRSHARERD
jgi:hypothetical protein